MRLVVITHTPHYQSPDGWKAYGPYVREMDLWMSGSVQTIIVAPVASVAPEAIHRSYANQNIELHPVPAVSLTGVRAVLHNLWMAPRILWTLYKAMRQADHIHLRCPGNMGLAGSLVQILFPKKPKTAKYAGNWDPKAQQPRSYRFQKWILSNTWISRNMKVLVYGSWSGQSDNVVPFMTASYRRDQIRPFVPRDFSGPLKFLFVGSLSKGKRPDYAVELINNLKKSGYEVSLDLFGDGVMRQDIQERIDSGAPACLHGNVSADRVEQAYRAAHFVVLPSRSEGWPKVLAEGMFWGCIPIASRVSCVPWMLDHGQRGLLLDMDLPTDLAQLKKRLAAPDELLEMAHSGSEWSRDYTLEGFQDKIKAILYEGSATY